MDYPNTSFFEIDLPEISSESGIYEVSLRLVRNIKICGKELQYVSWEEAFVRATINE